MYNEAGSTSALRVELSIMRQNASLLGEQSYV